MLPSSDNVPNTRARSDNEPLSHMLLDLVEDDMFVGGETGEEEGSRTGEILVEDVTASEEMVAATLNVSVVCGQEGANEEVVPNEVVAGRSPPDVEACIDPGGNEAAKGKATDSSTPTLAVTSKQEQNTRATDGSLDKEGLIIGHLSASYYIGFTAIYEGRDEGGTPTTTHYIGGSPIRCTDDEHIVVDAMHKGSVQLDTNLHLAIEEDATLKPILVLVCRLEEHTEGAPSHEPMFGASPPPMRLERAVLACALQALRNYLLLKLCEDKEKLLCYVCKWCKAFTKSSEWSVSLLGYYLNEGGAQHISDVDVKGLVNLVPRNGPGDQSINYCINGFAIDYYNSLLDKQQHLFPKWC
ncbi:hypothetical protein Cgig2_018565 [Carnegiea gigantea]|uniref:Uncharacterized protein n=1 Tax=Carnegiea gigantea TaxID=171969 RepID=A0A9Q1KLA1_9CARY|nr:hypothetical protein Cgig2_018565 [Carnegiea gigantea]